MKKRKLLLILMVVLSLVLTLPAVTAQDDPFRLAIVAPSTVNDLAFTQSMYEGLLAIQEEMGEENFEFTFLESTFVVDDAEAAVREWVNEDYDLIMAHGGQYSGIIENIAPEYPDQAFAFSSDVPLWDYENVFYYEGAAQDGGYVNGYMAASLSETGVMGVVGPIEISDAKLYVDGFKAGAAAYAEENDEEVTVNVNYIGSFSDVALATEAAETHVANDADVLTGTAQIVVGPIGVAQENGDVLWFGTQASHIDLAGDVNVMNQLYHWDVILKQMIENVQNGVLGGETYLLTFENEGLTMEINEDYFGDDEAAYEAFQAKVEELVEGIVSGDIVIFPEEE